GDSGSVVLNTTGQAVGLLWGGENNGVQAYASRIKDVESELGVLVSQNTVKGQTLTVPNGNIDGVPDAGDVRVSAEAALRALVARTRRSPQARRYVELALRNQTEMRQLAASGAPIVATFRRWGG